MCSSYRTHKAHQQISNGKLAIFHLMNPMFCRAKHDEVVKCDGLQSKTADRTADETFFLWKIELIFRNEVLELIWVDFLVWIDFPSKQQELFIGLIFFTFFESSDKNHFRTENQSFFSISIENRHLLAILIRSWQCVMRVESNWSVRFFPIRPFYQFLSHSATNIFPDSKKKINLNPNNRKMVIKCERISLTIFYLCFWLNQIINLIRFIDTKQAKCST